MRPRTLVPLLIALVVLPGVAAADEPPDPSAWYPRLTGGAGFGGWLGDVAGLTPSGLAVRVEAEAQVRPALFATAGLDLASVVDDDEMLIAPVAGTVKHASLAVRHPLFSFGESPTTLGGDMFVLVGAGREWTHWERGGRLQRTTVSLGMGGTIVLPRGDERRPFALIRYGFRMLFARAPDPGKLPLACDGPCEELTRTRPYDKTIILELTGHYGR